MSDLELIQRAYRVLSAIDNQWPARSSAEGQALLVDLNTRIAEATNQSGEEIQNRASRPLIDFSY